MEAKSRYSEARRITLAGAAKNVVLAFLKILLRNNRSFACIICRWSPFAFRFINRYFGINS